MVQHKEGNETGMERELRKGNNEERIEKKHCQEENRKQKEYKEIKIVEPQHKEGNDRTMERLKKGKY